MVQVVPAVMSVINTELCGLWLPVASCPPRAACLCTEQVCALCPSSQRWRDWTCCRVAVTLPLAFLCGFACDTRCLWVELLGRVACIL